MPGISTHKEIILASGNRGKLAEIKAILADQPYTLRSQSEFNISEAEETGLTFVENALIKARHAARHSGLIALADDSGIEVDYLKGAPGIYSARYAGQPGDDRANNAKLLSALADVPVEQRTARFQCVMVLVRHANDPTPLICGGTWQGTIVEKASGANGFGYDPLFYVPTHACTSAQLSPETKNRLSHRGQALRQLAIKCSDFLANSRHALE